MFLQAVKRYSKKVNAKSTTKIMNRKPFRYCKFPGKMKMAKSSRATKHPKCWCFGAGLFGLNYWMHQWGPAFLLMRGGGWYGCLFCLAKQANGKVEAKVFQPWYVHVWAPASHFAPTSENHEQSQTNHWICLGCLDNNNKDSLKWWLDGDLKWYTP